MLGNLQARTYIPFYLSHHGEAKVFFHMHFPLYLLKLYKYLMNVIPHFFHFT